MPPCRGFAAHRSGVATHPTPAHGKLCAVHDVVGGQVPHRKTILLTLAATAGLLVPLSASAAGQQPAAHAASVQTTSGTSTTPTATTPTFTTAPSTSTTPTATTPTFTNP